MEVITQFWKLNERIAASNACNPNTSVVKCSPSSPEGFVKRKS
jgi:hypothetical protein